MSTTLDRVVVVGASAAGLTAAESLRREGYEGELLLVGDEPSLPYDRPPLSKQVLTGAWSPGQVALREPSHYRDLNLDLRLGRRATALDSAAKILVTDSKETIEFDGLVVATGLRPRTLPSAAKLSGVHVLRTLNDAISLRAAFESGGPVVVVGAGVLGCEVAAVARSLRLDVTLVDATDYPMALVLNGELGSILANVHRAQGVDVRLSSGVNDVIGDSNGRVSAVVLANGDVLACEVLVVAIGATPATDWLEGSGLTIDNGVVCDERCAAADGVFAAGDVARWFNRQVDSLTRVEHRMNATEQGMHVARAMLGSELAFAPIPYFWSDQYDLKIQAYGYFPRGAETTVLDGDVSSGRFVTGFQQAGVTVGVMGWGMPGAFRHARNRVVSRYQLT